MVRAAAVAVSHSALRLLDQGSVENGRKFFHGGRGEATMPDGAVIFETSGAWPDFSTLSRISVCLIAIDFKSFQIGSRGGRTARRCRRTRSVVDVKDELRNVLASELALRKISHPRIDGLCVDPCA
jgi:hypothetical protein